MLGVEESGRVGDEPDSLGQKERVALLRGVPAFQFLPAEALEVLAAGAGETRVAAGEHVIVEGEEGDRAYVVAGGTAEASADRPRAPVLLASYGRGEMFGELALISEDGQRQATVTATTPLTALTVDSEAFDDLLHTYPETRDTLAHEAETLLVVKFLKAATPFTHLGIDAARRLAERVTPIMVPLGADLMREGEPGNACYLIRSGTMEVCALEDGGNERQIAMLEPGSIVGEAALLTDAPRNATVRALEACTLLELQREDLLEVVGSDRGMGRELTELVRLRDRPRRKPSVTAHERTDALGDVITTLKDSDRSVYYRLSEEGSFVWKRLDGNHTLRDLTLELMQARGVFAPQRIADLESSLAAAGFLEASSTRGDVIAGADAPSWPLRIATLTRHVLEWEVSLPPVDGLLARVYRRGIRPLYTWPGQLVLALLASTGLAIFIANYHTASTAEVRTGWLLLVFYVVYILSLTLHELGHAFTVKAFGRKVVRAGVGWYWFGPIAYVDTSDTWMEGRWPRIAVTIGGLYTTVLIAGASAIVAATTAGSSLSLIAWQLAFLSYFTLLINLNPVMELDGYYILMDWLDRPNLRAHCLAWLGRDLPRVWRDRAELRRHRLELAFGCGSVAYVVLMAVLTLVVYRPIIAGWLRSVLPPAAASGVAWAFAGTLVVLTMVTLAGDLRDARHAGSKG